MNGKKLIKSWKYPSILLIGIGIANLGEWIYFIALNLIILEMTGSPLGVAALYILKPFAAIFTNIWAGSLIDRLNKRVLMITLNSFRAFFIFILPFLPSLWSIYLVVFIINMASSMYRPTSMTYITKLIPAEQRQRFNSLRSLIDSGGFLLGPAITGMLFLIVTPMFAIFINAIALGLSVLITFLMPNVEKQASRHSAENRFSVGLVKKDWCVVLRFSRDHRYIMFVYFLFSCMMVMATAIDSLEAAFSKEVLHLSNSNYGFLVSIAGAGIIVGSLINSIFTKWLSPSKLIGFGSLFVSVGYLIYAFSSTFFSAAIGFFVLSFSLAFANTGFQTFYQNNIPAGVMGRVGSVYELIEAVLIMIATAIFGAAAQLISIQFAVILGSAAMFALTVMLCIGNLQPSKANYYVTTDIKG
ncbi:MFS transporter [Priestia megaterium]|nr:MFS transporter [Priestia megaterium]